MRLIASSTCALLVAATAGAAETRYAVQAQAQKAGEHIMVTCTVTETAPDGRTSVLSRPQVLFAIGKQARILVGDASASDAYQGEIINSKGKEEVLVISTVTRGGDIVWAEAKTIRIEGDAGDQGRRLNGSSGSSGGSGTILSTRQQAHPGQTRARVLIDYKHRIAGRDADWTPGSMATLTGGLITLDTAVCEIGRWDGKGSTIKAREGHLVPVEPADFEAGRIGKLDAEQGEHAYPIAPGKVFALRFKSGTGADAEALIRIFSIKLQNMTATSVPTAPR